MSPGRPAKTTGGRGEGGGPGHIRPATGPDPAPSPPPPPDAGSLWGGQRAPAGCYRTGLERGGGWVSLLTLRDERDRLCDSGELWRTDQPCCPGCGLRRVTQCSVVPSACQHRDLPTPAPFVGGYVTIGSYSYRALLHVVMGSSADCCLLFVCL